MPVFELQTQDGKKYQVDAPDQMSAVASLSSHARSPASLLDKAMEPLTSLPATYQSMVKEGIDRMGRGVEQIKSKEPWEILKGLGNTAFGAIEYTTAPINAPIHTIVGKPVEENTGIPSSYTEFAASMALPMPKAMPRMGRAPSTASAPTTLAAAKENIATSFDPFGQRVAETPQEAGDIVSRSIQSTEKQRKAAVNTAFTEARSLGGRIHAGVFEGMPNKIKYELSSGTEPVIVDDKLTPYTAQMLKDIDERVANLKIQNKADPYGQPNAETIVGVNLSGVDQMRKRLSTFRKDAFNSGNASDARAARSVLDAFDDQIDRAINGGLFTGDKRAIDAWYDARAMYGDYRKTFKAGKNDPVGRVIEKIIGKSNNPSAIPNDVADFMYGSAGINPTSLNVQVVNRVKGILGDRSPEWTAVKQGLFERIVNAGEGVTEFGPGKVANRLNRFLNSDGKEMSTLVFSRAERDALQKYADLMKQLEVPKAGANWSNTSVFAAEGYRPSIATRALQAVGSNIGSGLAAVLGHFVIPGLPFGAAEAGGWATAKIAGMSAQAREARVIARQMPIIGKTYKDYSTALMAAESSPTPRTIARLTLAARNLSTNLKDVGINLSADDLLRAIQGPVPATADQEKQ